MLSKIDILKELGKGICVYPLDTSNIKENSINLCAGSFAWTTVARTVHFCESDSNKDTRFSLERDGVHSCPLELKSGGSAVVEGAKGEKYILLLPCSTTLIETKEVLAVSSYIGGTYHSKVGLVSKGLGHIATMVGPNFSGDSLIAVHNVSDRLIVLRVGESFVSVVFHYLNTPYPQLNPTASGHTDKFSALGIHASDDDISELTQDWKKNFQMVCEKMTKSKQYEDAKNELNLLKKRRIITRKNVIALLGVLMLLGVPLILAVWADIHTNNPVWLDRYITTGFSGFFIVVLGAIWNYLKNDRN